MLISLLTADDNINNKRVYIKLGHDCTVRDVWCDWIDDPAQLNWTILANRSESKKTDQN